MIRCTVRVNKIEEVKDALEAIIEEKVSSNFDILKIKNNLDNHVSNVNIKLIYLSRIIGEIQIKYAYS